MVATVRPFLMFQGQAESAMDFYASTFPDAEILDIEHYETEEAGSAGKVKVAHFALAGQEILIFDSLVQHDFSFTPAFSLFVECESEDEIERLNAALSDGGAVMMPLDNYGFSRKFAWVSDKYGVSWQLILR